MLEFLYTFVRSVEIRYMIIDSERNLHQDIFNFAITAAPDNALAFLDSWTSTGKWWPRKPGPEKVNSDNIDCLLKFTWVIGTQGKLMPLTGTIQTIYYTYNTLFTHYIQWWQLWIQNIHDSKVRGANVGPIWGRQDPGGPHVGPMNVAIWNVPMNVAIWDVAYC